MSEPPLERFGRFLLLRALAEGGMGMLYIAYDPARARIVALKRLGRRVSEELRARFSDEAQVTRRLSHPHLVEFVDAGEVDGERYLALGFVPGHDLHALCSRVWQAGRRVPAERAFELAGQLADALAYAHASGDGSYVHRDVTPMNVLVGHDGSVRLADHGLAKTRTKAFHTVPGVATGTVGFVSPEQLAAGPVDRRTDVYGVGGVLWFMLTGRPPCDPLDPTRSLVAERRLAHFAPGLPDAVQAVVYRALAAVPDERYASAGVLKDALGEALVALRALSDAPLESPSLAMLMEAGFPKEARALEEELARFSRQAASSPRGRATWVPGLVLGAAALGLVALLFVALSPGRRDRRAEIAPSVMTAVAAEPGPTAATPSREGGEEPTAAVIEPPARVAEAPALAPPRSVTAAGGAAATQALGRRYLEARALARRGMFARAVTLYDELERDGAPRAQVLTGRAELALLRGEHDEAIRVASQAIRLGGGTAPLLVRARAFGKSGRREESAADLRLVLSRDPANEDARRALRDVQ